ncbi:MAG: ribosome small subunit-dependent GTPase A [Oscillospiraceae bacterium]|nr:ribosome small subunit-dependent GTPase A [Oscillospiraceae bacterium]
MTRVGTIVKSLAGFYYVDCGGETVTCRARGRFRFGDGVAPLVGDRVEVLTADAGSDSMLREMLPRRNAFVRPPVANIDTLVIVVTDAPPAADAFLIDRMIVAAERSDCEPFIVFNKSDVSLSALLDVYHHAGFHAFSVSASTGDGIDELRIALASGGVSAFSGNSGVGKSSLLNAMGLDLPVGEVSDKLGRGRHTTRHVELHTFDFGDTTLKIIDTPGFSSFDGIDDAVDARDLPQYFRDFAPYLDDCRFRDCQHGADAGCAVRDAAERGDIAPSRYRSYLRLLEIAQDAAANAWR